MATATDEALLAAAGGLSAGLVAEGPLRRFSLGLGLNRLEASQRMPLNLASVMIELELPQELAGECRHPDPAGSVGSPACQLSLRHLVSQLGILPAVSSCCPMPCSHSRPIASLQP